MRGRIALAVGCVVLAAGCASRPPQGVTDLNRMWGELREGCAGVYAADETRSLEPEVEAMNALVADEKYRKAGKEAEALLPRVESLRAGAEGARVEARQRAEAAVGRAEEALAAAQEAEAETHDAAGYGSARSKLDLARRELGDPCGYRRAAELAAEAERLAGRSRSAAIAEKQRIEAERRRAEEQARRLEEERRRKARPPAYTVRQGDSLWRISGMEKVYGNPIYWPVLYEANRDRIGDPDLIYPDQELQIPREIPEDAMRERARRFYRTYAPPSAE
ncbi:MAG: LysM peptidoglycan-binding domain-containing protein [Acidobacteriota bacterium]